jgi:hypothetical protein
MSEETGGTNTKREEEKSNNEQLKMKINKKPTTNNQQPTTNNQQPATNNQQPTTNNQQPTTNNQQPTTNHQLTIIYPAPNWSTLLLLSACTAAAMSPECMRSYKISWIT